MRLARESASMSAGVLDNMRVVGGVMAVFGQAYELNKVSAELARKACDEVEAKDPSRPRYVMGARTVVDYWCHVQR